MTVPDELSFLGMHRLPWSKASKAMSKRERRSMMARSSVVGNLILRRGQLLLVALLTVAVWPTTAWACMGCDEGRGKPVAFSPDGRLVASGVGSETVIWTVADGRRVGRVPVAGNPAFDTTGRLVIGETFDGDDNDPKVWVVDPSSWKLSSSFSVATEPMGVSVAWTLDGNLITWGHGWRGSLKPIRRWTPGGKRISDWSPYCILRLSSDGRWAALQSTQPGRPADWDVRLVDLSTGSRVRVWPGASVLGFSEEALYFSRRSDRTTPVTNSQGTTFLMPQRDLVKVDLANLEERSWAAPMTTSMHTWVLPNGLVASVDESRTPLLVEFREFGQAKPLITLPGVGVGDASPDGRWFVGYTGVWSLVNGKQVASFPVDHDYRVEIAFSPDSRYLLRAQWKGNSPSVTLHDLTTGTQRTLR